MVTCGRIVVSYVAAESSSIDAPLVALAVALKP
jgi:hypothetical protein